MAYYIPSHQTLGQHPKTKKLARMLSISLPCAVGHLQFLWWWALDYAQDGDISQYDHDDVADAALWEGDALQFWLALVAAGFVDDLVDDGRALIHDWPEYGGKLLEKRKADALRKERTRMSSGLPTDIRVTAQVEKRKEEKTEEKRKEENIREPTALGVRHKPVDEEFLLSLEGEYPGVNVRDVYARAQNRKTWDGYKDKRRALRDHVGYALEDQRKVNGNGRTRAGGIQQRPDDEDPIAKRIRLDRERAGQPGLLPLRE